MIRSCLSNQLARRLARNESLASIESGAAERTGSWTRRQAARLGRRQFVMRSAVALSALLLSLGVGAFSATSASASVITSLSGVAHPGYVARATSVTGARWEYRDFWTGAVTVDRHLDVSTGVIYQGLNPAAAMRSQVTLQRWNGSSWVTYQRRAAYNGTTGGFLNSRAWFFSNEHFGKIPAGYYRAYTWYWFLNSSGQVIGTMTEKPEMRDFAQLLDGGPDAVICNTAAGTPGCIYVP
jgi:hypothetical protein